MENIVLGIDIGGTNSTFGFVTKGGETLIEDSIKTRGYQSFDVYLQTLADLINLRFNELEKGKFQIAGIGVGAPNGNYFKGTIEEAPNLEWRGEIPFVDSLKKHFDVPVALTNDANAAAMGEMLYGSAKGMKNFIMITLGTGLGSGIVVNGDLVYGHDGHAGELGHVTVNPNGRMCGCGRRGCLETYVSATGIKRTVYKMLADTTYESELRSVSFNDLSPRNIHEAALRGDRVAKMSFDYTGQILGQKLADTVAHTSPQAIFLFGGLAKAGDYIFKPTRQHLEKNLLNIYKNKISVLPSGLMDKNVAVLGAAALVWNIL